MVHLVNHATDQGIDPLIAATFMSVIGLISIAGRLSIGVVADRIGVYFCMVISGLFLITAFVIVQFTTTIWGFYLFAIIFSIRMAARYP
jgi:predicted MFS family arabinose efflux permease